ncbi:MAG: hypothetical protein KDA20_06375 [Phycisphaerales bacterium]|nr:hypothetical protein [Phycisphaerales bacterium]
MIKGVACTVGLVGLALVAPARAADTTEQADAIVDRYLERIGLDELLVRRLADRIALMKPGDDRAEAVTLLANAYARLLDEAETDAQRQRWESAAADLIQNAPNEATTELRLSLARVTYRQLEDTATKWMMAMVDEGDRQITLRRLMDLLGELDRLADRAQGEYQMYEQRESNERRPGAVQAWSERKAEAGRLRSMTHYLAGWTALHVADLEPDRDRQAARATRALAHLGWLLNAPRDRSPELDRVPEGTLVFEHVARAAIASAAAFARAGEPSTADAWFEMLESAANLHPGARDVLRQRHCIALAQAGRWAELADLMLPTSTDAIDQPLSVADARLLAALALSHTSDQPWGQRDERSRERVRDRALAALVAANELGHVLDLSKRFGLDQLTGDSFVAHQVKALRLYQQAREDHELQGASDAPTSDQITADKYRLAAAQFEAALRAPDAAAFPDALGSCVMLLGLAQYYAGMVPADGATLEPGAGLLTAADAFEQASRDLRDPNRAASALWMAIHALTQVIDAGDAPDTSALVTRRDRLEARFLSAYPDHPQAAAITIRRAGSGSGGDLEERIDMLRQVDPASPMRASAERQAARLAYDAWRSAANASERDWMASRYLALAEPLLADDRRGARESEEAAQRAMLRARRMAEVALSMGAPDIARAQAALDVADALIAEHLVDPGAADELQYRRAQLVLATGDFDGAREIVDRLQLADPRFAIAAQRLFFRHAQRAWQRVQPESLVPSAQALTEPQRLAAHHLIDAGEALLAGLAARTDDPAADAEVPHVCRAMVRALCALYFADQDAPAGEQALALNQRILDTQPRDAEALRRAAELLEAGGHIEPAMDAWRALLAGLPPTDTAWFEAKYRLLRLLAQQDPARARTVLDQHRVLHPSYGPTPWGERLRELDRQIPPAPAQASEGAP